MTQIVSLTDALQVEEDDDAWQAYVQPGYDVFGIPHGGYLAALGANAVLHASGQPDIFSITTHFLRKSTFAPIRFAVHRVGASRRFATWSAIATQDDQVVMSVMASVGDRTTFTGPRWSQLPGLELFADVTPKQSFEAMGDRGPSIAAICGLQLDTSSAVYLEGRVGEEASIQGMVTMEPADQLAGIIACDVGPPAAWNVLGPRGWVPTVELTAHVRAHPAPGSLRFVAESRFIADGLLDEDALVYDSAGTLVVQSRQLARWSEQ